MEDAYGAGDARYVDTTADAAGAAGTLPHPYVSFKDGVDHNPSGGTLWIRTASFDTTGTFNRPAVWRAYLGNVIVGQ
jgi:hypothetical protein